MAKKTKTTKELPAETKRAIINRNLQGLQTEAYDLELAIKINTDLEIHEQKTEGLIENLKNNKKQQDAYEKKLEELT